MAGGGKVVGRPQLDWQRSNLTAIPSPTEYFDSDSNLTILVYTRFIGGPAVCHLLRAKI